MPLDAPAQTEAERDDRFDFASRLEGEVAQLQGYQAMLRNLPDFDDRLDLGYLFDQMGHHRARMQALVEEFYPADQTI